LLFRKRRILSFSSALTMARAWAAFRQTARSWHASPAAVTAAAAALLATRTPATSSRARCHSSESEQRAKEVAEIKHALERMATVAPKAGGSFELLEKLRQLEDDWWIRGKVHRVVLTGGPCGGKSTVLTDMQQMLRERNYLVFSMPEIATQMWMWSDGKMWDDFSAEGSEDDQVWAALQVTLTRVQMVVEDSIIQMAKRSLAKRRSMANPPRGAVILLDRGVVDNMAYCTKEAWAMVLEELGTTTARLRDGRYDHVVHLVTAANGAEKFYSLQQAEGENVGARTETVEEARERDSLTQEAWRGAKSHFIVGNQGVDFEQKRRNVKDIVSMIVGDTTGRLSSPMARILCMYLPSQEIKNLAASDPSIPWVVSMRLTITYLSKNTRLQKCEVKNESTYYYHQEVSDDGSRVTLQYPMDSWSYFQKLREAAISQPGPDGQMSSETLRELVVDRVTFPFKDMLIRCNSMMDEEKGSAQLVAEIQPGTCAADLLPGWLKAIPGHERRRAPIECL